MWMATNRAYPLEMCVIELSEQQAQRQSHALAVVQGEACLSYGQLDRRANRLAHHLRQLGVGSDVLVGLCVERSLEMIVGIMGVLKAGGAYLPLDPTYPPERLAFMLEDSRVAVLITTTGEIDKETGRQGDKETQSAHDVTPSPCHLVTLSQSWSAIALCAADNPVGALAPANLAYVIYTSGSTGQPKGAMNSHAGIVNRLRWMQDAYGLAPDDHVLQKTPFSFDVSVWEFFWPLMEGARLVIARPGGHQDSAYLVETISEQSITTVHFVPSMLAAFLEEPGVERCASLRRVICSGEALTAGLQERFFARLGSAPGRDGPQLHNLYGPTEAAVDVTYWACRPSGDQASVPIGRPITNVQTYVLDAQLHLAPIGVPGELHIGGVALARGYLKRPDLTAERFVPNPFLKDEGGRRKEEASSFILPPSSFILYKTGDLARWRADGTLEYLGRLDEQVKLRGFRIEPGEIEAVLDRHPAVQASVVMLRADAPGGVGLVAYVVPTREQGTGDRGQEGIGSDSGSLSPVTYHLSPQELRGFLQERLPAYMIPAAFVTLERLPLSANGKIDRRAPPAPDPALSDDDGAFIAPRTPTEELIARTWADALGQARVDVHANFFELGGHSLLATQVLARLRALLEVELPLRQLFENP